MINAHIVSAFTFNSIGGNKAGVVILKDSLQDNEMQAIAAQLNLSETVFATRINTGEFKVRFFTPTSEIEYCGHATVALFYLLKEKNLIPNGKFLQHTLSQKLIVEVEDNYVFTYQGPPHFSDYLPTDDFLSAFNLTQNDVAFSQFPLQKVSTGVYDAILAVNDREILFNLKPDLKAIADLSCLHGIAGIHVFALDPINQNALAHSRNFAPYYGIDEESATGSSTGALLCYLHHYNPSLVNENTPYFFEQGHILNKPSQLIAAIELTQDKNIREIKVGGKAIIVDSKFLINGKVLT